MGTVTAIPEGKLRKGGRNDLGRWAAFGGTLVRPAPPPPVPQAPRRRLRTIQETEDGCLVSEGDGWRDPWPGEFVATQDGPLDLNGERAAVAWWKGFAAGLLAAMAGLAILACCTFPHGIPS